MAKYNVYTRISTNVSAEYLLYDLKLYRYDSSGTQTVILEVTHQQLQSNYETQKHETQETRDGPEVIYLMDLMLYRKSMMNTRKVLKEPFTRKFTLSEFQSGKVCATDKRGNACYFETVVTTQPADQGENIFELKISSPVRAFIAKKHSVGSSSEPFEKSLIENQIASRYMVSSCYLIAALLLIFLSMACTEKVSNMRVFDFFEKVRNDYTHGYKKVMDDIPTNFYVYEDDDSDIWYKAESFTVKDKENVAIETIDVRVTKGEGVPYLISMILKDSCITIKKLREVYSEINLTNVSRSDAPGAKFYYTTPEDDNNVTMSFGFTNASPDCLANVVIKKKMKRITIFHLNHND